MTEAMERAAAKAPATVPVTADHKYVFSITGKCVRCQRPEDAHPVFRDRAAPGECIVDHDSITIRRPIGDYGWQWSRCPICGNMLEPRFPSIGAQGKDDGKGRGDLTPGMKKRLAGLAGWWAYNGGDNV